MKNLDTTAVWGKKLVNYINANLSQANSKLRWQCKKLKENNLVTSFGSDQQGIWVKKDENGSKKRVEIEADLDMFIPGNVSRERIFSN